MADNSILDLDQRLRPLARQFLDACNTLFKTRITVTWRSNEQQDLVKAKGLSNAHGGESPHNCCDAQGNPSSKGFDFAVFEKDGTYVTDGKDPRYSKAGEIAKGLGLYWGGDFSHPDPDHCEMTHWKSI